MRYFGFIAFRIHWLIALLTVGASAHWVPYNETEGTVVKLTGGYIRGLVATSAEGDELGVRIFQGVPYARPPLDGLRFRRAQSSWPWLGVRNATRQKPVCPNSQLPKDGSTFVEHEDCLYLHILTTTECIAQKCPIVFYIRSEGSAESFDSILENYAEAFGDILDEGEDPNETAELISDLHRYNRTVDRSHRRHSRGNHSHDFPFGRHFPRNSTHRFPPFHRKPHRSNRTAELFSDPENEQLNSTGLIFVIPQYRVGVLGFADFGEDVKGSAQNIGLYDLLSALKWTQREIGAFGGERRLLTVTGDQQAAFLVETVAAASSWPVRTLLPSVPIPQFRENEKATEKILRRIGCQNSTAEKQIQCARDQTWEELRTSFGTFGPQLSAAPIIASSYRDLIETGQASSSLLFLQRRYPSPNETVASQCWTALEIFGFKSNDHRRHHKCIQRYSASPKQSLATDVAHSIGSLIGRRGAKSKVPVYLGIGKLEETSVLISIFGNESLEENGETEFQQLHSEAVENFLRGEKPLSDWPPVNRKGENYYFIDFGSSTGPHPHTDYEYNADGVDFWLNRIGSHIPFRRPPRPQPDDGDADESTVSPTSRQPRSTTRYGVADTTRPPPVATKRIPNAFAQILPRTETPKPSKINESTISADDADSRVWAAFWGVLSLAIILSVILIVITASRLMHKVMSRRDSGLLGRRRRTSPLSDEEYAYKLNGYPNDYRSYAAIE